MADLKTKPTQASVQEFLEGVDNGQKRADSYAILELMKRVTGEEPRMWGPSLIGFGTYHYKYDSGREGDWFLTGFSPRKQALTLYVMSGFDKQPELMARLGKHSTGKSCLYIKRLADVDVDVLEQLVRDSVEYVRTHNRGC